MAMRILIIEDNRRLAESIRDILKYWYDCDICEDGRQGAVLLPAGGYDAAILDLMQKASWRTGCSGWRAGRIII